MGTLPVTVSTSYTTNGLTSEWASSLYGSVSGKDDGALAVGEHAIKSSAKLRMVR